MTNTKPRHKPKSVIGICCDISPHDTIGPDGYGLNATLHEAGEKLEGPEPLWDSQMLTTGEPLPVRLRSCAHLG